VWYVFNFLSFYYLTSAFFQPIQVSVKLPDEYFNIRPIIEEEKIAQTERSPLTISTALSLVSSYIHSTFVGLMPFRQDSFPFLPLPCHFDHQSGEAWAELAMLIQSVLVQSSHGEEMPCYVLAREFFWMAFVAAFPSFPFGEWPEWDLRIPMRGTFISAWVEDLDLSLPIQGAQFSQSVRRYIWDELADAVTFFFSMSLLSDS